MSSERHYEDLIDDAFMAEASMKSEVRAHLVGCAKCRERYNRLVRAERKLSGNARVSPYELARAEGAVFSRLEVRESWLGQAKRAASEASGDGREGFARAGPVYRVRTWRPVLLGAAAVAAVLLLFVILPPREEDELRARGAATEARPAAIHAFCLTETGPVPLESGKSCSLSSRLKLSLENRGEYRYVFLVGVQSDRSPRWYEPRPPEMESKPAPFASQGEVPFGGAVRLEVNHEKGPLRIYGIFSDRPISSAAVEEAVRLLAKDSETLPLPMKDVAQRSILVEVAP